MDNETRSSVVRKCITIIIVAVILIGLALYFIPWPTEISVRSPCAEIDQQGNILSDQGNMVLEGTYYDYLFQDDSFLLTHIELPNVQNAVPVEFISGPVPVQPMPAGGDYIWFPYALNLPGKTFSGKLMVSTTKDFQFFMITYSSDLDKRTDYVSTAPDDPTPVEILREFLLLQTEKTD